MSVCLCEPGGEVFVYTASPTNPQCPIHAHLLQERQADAVSVSPFSAWIDAVDAVERPTSIDLCWLMSGLGDVQCEVGLIQGGAAAYVEWTDPANRVVCYRHNVETPEALAKALTDIKAGRMPS